MGSCHLKIVRSIQLDIHTRQYVFYTLLNNTFVNLYLPTHISLKPKMLELFLKRPTLMSTQRNKQRLHIYITTQTKIYRYKKLTLLRTLIFDWACKKRNLKQVLKKGMVVLTHLLTNIYINTDIHTNIHVCFCRFTGKHTYHSHNLTYAYTRTHACKYAQNNYTYTLTHQNR